MEFLPLVGSVIVAAVAYFAIHANNSRADQRDYKSWYRKMLLENSVAFIGKMDEALAAIADSHEAYVDMDNNISDREWNDRAEQKLRLNINELRSAALLVNMSCSPETTKVVDKVVKSFEEALTTLNKKFRLSDYASEIETQKSKEYQAAASQYEIYGDNLQAMKPRVLAVIKADLAAGGFPAAEKAISGQLNTLEKPAALEQSPRG